MGSNYDIEEYKNNYPASLDNILRDKDVEISKERDVKMHRLGNEYHGQINITDTRRTQINYETPSQYTKKDRIFPIWVKILMATCTGLLFYSYSQGGEIGPEKERSYNCVKYQNQLEEVKK